MLLDAIHLINNAKPTNRMPIRSPNKNATLKSVAFLVIEGFALINLGFSSQCIFGNANDSRKSDLIADCNVGQHLTIQTDICQF